MSRSETFEKNATQWREHFARNFRNGELGERVLRRLNLPEEFSCTTYPMISWRKFGGTLLGDEKNALGDLKRMVATTSAVLGSPDSVSSEAAWWGGSVPDLKAEWKVELTEEEKEFSRLEPTGYSLSTITVYIEISSPQGCAIKPGTEYVAATKPELHPECVHVLEEIEDADYTPVVG